MLSLLRRRPKTFVMVLLLFGFLSYSVYCGVTVAGVRSFRKRPQRSEAVTYFQGNLPHNILARMAVFRRGSKDYNTDMLEWAYHSKLITDNFLNRWILEGNLLEAPEPEGLALLPHYPLTPTDNLMPLLKKALSEDRYQVLPVLCRSQSQEATDIFQSWIQERVVRPRNAKLFVAASGYLAQVGASSLPELINRFWPDLTPGRRQMVVIKLAAHLSSEPQISNAIFAWANSVLLDSSKSLDCSTIALLGRFFSIVSLREKSAALIGKNAAGIQHARVPLLLHFAQAEDLPQMAGLVINQVKDKNPRTVLEVIHYVAHKDIHAAEVLAEPFLPLPDSETRKGAIVMLARHDSAKGRELINESFTGAVPRKTLYLSSLAYEQGNAAADLYRKLSTHDYRETGKTWPPTYFAKTPSAEEVSQWKKFIGTYPWFPGTDDAYYRLAFSQFALRDYRGCFATIKEYLNRAYWPDNDIRPFMMHLLRQLILVSEVADAELPFAQHLRTVTANPLGLMLIGSQENLSSVIYSLDWFLLNPEYLRFLNTDAATLQIVRNVAVQLQSSPYDSACRLVAAKIEAVNPYPSSADTSTDLENMVPADMKNLADTQEGKGATEAGADDPEVARILEICWRQEYSEDQFATYPATVAQSVLYGIYDNFRAPESSARRIDIPLDPSETAIRQVASYLNDHFKGASVNEVREHRLDEMIVLALLHSGSEFDERSELFKPTTDFLSAVNEIDIPDVVSARYSALLKRRR